MWFYWFSFCCFVTVELHPVLGKKHAAWSNSVSRAVVYTLCEYFVIVQYCTYLWLATTWYCMSVKDYIHSHKHTYTIPDNQSNIVMNWSKSTLNYLVLSTCVGVRFFHHLVATHQWKGTFELLDFFFFFLYLEIFTRADFSVQKDYLYSLKVQISPKNICLILLEHPRYLKWECAKCPIDCFEA